MAGNVNYGSNVWRKRRQSRNLLLVADARRAFSRREHRGADGELSLSLSLSRFSVETFLRQTEKFESALARPYGADLINRTCEGARALGIAERYYPADGLPPLLYMPPLAPRGGAPQINRII